MLTTAQLQALKADIAANTNTIPAGPDVTAVYVGATINQINTMSGNNADGAAAIASWYSLTSSPDFFVFRSDVPADDITNQVTWANFTPSVALAGDGSNAAMLTASSNLNQGRQFNLQLLLPPGGFFNAGLTLKRSGLNDATANNLQKGDGTLVGGGWSSILTILRRKALNIEKLFAVATTGVGTGVGALGATGNPGLLVVEGIIRGQDVMNAWHS